MKRAFIILTLSVGLFQCQSTKSEHTHEEVAEAYACPMECEGDKTYAEAGKCPVCKMDLAKVEH